MFPVGEVKAFPDNSLPNATATPVIETKTAPLELPPPAPVAYDPERRGSNTTESRMPVLLPTSQDTESKRMPAAGNSAAVPPSFPPMPELRDPEPVPAEMMGVELRKRAAPAGPVRSWVRAEYLMWWVKDAPLGVSLVTTGNPNNNPNAELLNSDRNFDTFGGLRLSAGCWCQDCHNIGLEASWFFLARRTKDFFTASDNNGQPMLAFPFVSNMPGGSGAFVLPVSSPGVYAGNVLVASSLSFWGTEANGVFCLVRERGFEFTALAGIRYADLLENLEITSVTTDITTNPNSVSILSDSFNTRNQFYGGQIGARFNWAGDSVSFDITGKLALGSTHQVVDIQGNSSQFGPTQPNGVFPSGFFAQSSNIGRYTDNRFTVMPSLEMKLNLLLTSRCRAFMGYDLVYWSQVVRPGSQVDRTLNLSQSPTLGQGALIGPASPGPLFNRTDFWAQGMSFGLEMRF